MIHRGQAWPEVEERKEEDACQIAMLLHALKIDQIMIENIIQLGKRLPIEAAADITKSRPVKLVVENEKQKREILKNEKNLEG